MDKSRHMKRPARIRTGIKNGKNLPSELAGNYSLVRVKRRNKKLRVGTLDQEGSKKRLQDLGLCQKQLEDCETALKRTQGIILVAGPTRSGKSSTLYSFLSSLNSEKINIMTVEDPVEFLIAGINQVQINPLAGMTYATGLRCILKQDPDIVMVGEIRDRDTAYVAAQAGQAGRLVLSTLHTNDAPSGVVRLVELGVPSFVVADSLVLAVAQQLVRKICQKCKHPDPLSNKILERLPSFIEKNTSTTLWKGAGCKACRGIGYSGFLGIFETLTITPSLKELIARNASALTLSRAAEIEGFQSMHMDGIRKALEGLTTIEEVYRVAPAGFGSYFGNCWH